MADSRILVVLDDPETKTRIDSLLRQHGYRVRLASDPMEAFALLAAERQDLVVVETSLPEMRGLDTSSRIREGYDVPIILVSDDDSYATMILALDLAADDYVTNPINPPLLLARVRAMLRRARSSQDPLLLHAGTLMLDIKQRQAHFSGETLSLTKTEFSILRVLAAHANSVVTFEHLCHSVWNEHCLDVRPVRVHISNLRRKMREAPALCPHIRNIEGVGYLLDTLLR